MKLYFATGNPHKFAEVQQIMKEFDIELEQVDIKGEEIQEIGRASCRERV